MQQRFPCFYVVCQTEVASIPRLRKTQAGMVALRAAPQRKASTVRAIWQRAMLALPPISQLRLFVFSLQMCWVLLQVIRAVMLIHG